MSETRFSLKRIAQRFLLLAFCLGWLVTIAKPAGSQTLTTLHSFTGHSDGNEDGSNPAAGVILDAQGNLYGTTTLGGKYCCGTVFKSTPTGEEAVLYSFTSAGGNPSAGLIWDSKGDLYGTAPYAGANGHSADRGTVFELKKQHNLKVLHRFDEAGDGVVPAAGLVSDAQGNLYGTTEYGGTGQCPPGGFTGCGAVFKVTAAGAETVLYSFCSLPNCADGDRPLAALVMDSEGNLYGTTQWGGAIGWGTVFKVTPGGTETVLYSFCSQTNCSDGALPVSGLIMDAPGNLYGTTYGGGSGGVSDCSLYVACGAVFKVTPSGKETVLYNFCSQTNCADGALPGAGLVFDAQGNLYGTTESGGTGSCNVGGTVPGCGTVFEITAAGAETALYSFCSVPGCTDGETPLAGLVFDSKGNLYGTTRSGGSGGGTLFKLTP